jgi:fucose permease
VAWCWAVNGFFSVIGSTATTMLSMTFGFDRTMLIGLVLYAVATAVMVTGRTSRDVPVVPVAQLQTVSGS